MENVAHGENNARILRRDAISSEDRHLAARDYYSLYRANRRHGSARLHLPLGVLPLTRQDVPCRPRSNKANRGSTP